jgi:hypothetical protein
MGIGMGNGNWDRKEEDRNGNWDSKWELGNRGGRNGRGAERINILLSRLRCATAYEDGSWPAYNLWGVCQCLSLPFVRARGSERGGMEEERTGGRGGEKTYCRCKTDGKSERWSYDLDMTRILICAALNAEEWDGETVHFWGRRGRWICELWFKRDLSL